MYIRELDLTASLSTSMENQSEPLTLPVKQESFFNHYMHVCFILKVKVAGEI